MADVKWKANIPKDEYEAFKEWVKATYNPQDYRRIMTEFVVKMTPEGRLPYLVPSTVNKTLPSYKYWKTNIEPGVLAKAEQATALAKSIPGLQRAENSRAFAAGEQPRTIDPTTGLFVGEVPIEPTTGVEPAAGAEPTAGVGALGGFPEPGKYSLYTQAGLIKEEATGKYYDLAHWQTYGQLVAVSTDRANALIAAVTPGTGEREGDRLSREQQERQFGQSFAQEQSQFEESMAFQRQQLAATSRENELKAALEWQKKLEGLSGPRDWIKYFFATNPAGPSPRATAYDQLRAINSEIEQVKEQLATEYVTSAAWKPDFATDTGAPGAPPESGVEALTKQLADLAKMQTSTSKLMDTLSNTPTQRQPRITPQLAPYIVGGEAGAALDPTGRIRTPSGQAVTRMDPDVLQSLLGTADYFSAQGTGRTATRLVSDIEAMQPGLRGQVTRIAPTRQWGA